MSEEREGVHLSDALILQAVVDEGDIPEHMIKHLTVCLKCRRERERIEENLTRLGVMAGRFSPPPSVRAVFRLKAEVSDFRRPSMWRVPMAAMSAAAAVLVFFAGSLLFTGGLDERRANLTTEAVQDEQFISEISRLEENALPQIYLDLSDTEETGEDTSHNNGFGQGAENTGPSSNGSNSNFTSSTERKKESHA